jgi:hypothetical protein
MPRTYVYEMRKDGTNIRKSSNHLHCQTAPLLPKNGTTGFLARPTQGLPGRSFNIVMRCESPEAIKTAVNKKLGVGILYWEVMKEEVARGLFK